MREIKFRAWSTADKKMYEPAYFDNLEVGWWNENDGLTEILGDRHENSMLHQVILMQFTGLKDCKGREIYEGDTIKGNLFDYRVPIRGDIVYDNEHATFALKNLAGLTFLFKIDQFEVIGNIHEDKP